MVTGPIRSVCDSFFCFGALFFTPHFLLLLSRAARLALGTKAKERTREDLWYSMRKSGVTEVCGGDAGPR